MIITDVKKYQKGSVKGESFDNKNIGTVITLKLTLFLRHEKVDWFHLAHNIYDRVTIITDVKKYQKGSLKGKEQLRP
jgi:hypothetical protein